MEKKEKNNVQEYFEVMENDIRMNKVSLSQFIEYYNNLKKAIASQLVKNPLNYLIVLLNAEIFPIIDCDEQEKLLKIRKELEDAIALLAKEQIEVKVDFNDYFEKMTSNINKQNISYEKFDEYFKMLKLAIMTKVENVDLVACATILFNAKIMATATYDQIVKINICKNRLIRYAFSLEQESQPNLR